MFRRCLILFLIFALLLPVTASAQSSPPNLLKEKQDAIKAGGNQEAWLNEALSSNLVSTLQILTGPIPDDVLTGTGYNWIPGGAIGAANNLIAALYTPPASGVEYLAGLRDNFLGVKSAYAQGVGFRGLQPILPIWRGFRNVVYALSSLVFIFMGLLIMLRIKISPQAVITVQNAIPRIITTLILVTFSYAIAGLLIDLMYLFQNLSLATLFSAMGKGLSDNLLKEDFFNAINPFTNAYDYSHLSHAGPTIFSSLAFLALPKNAILVIPGIIGIIVGTILSAQGNPIGGFFIGAAIPVVVMVLVAILILFWLTKFFFGLLKCYVTIIFKIVLAPLEIGIGAFPTIKIGFSSWILDLVANLAVFPISLLFLILGNLIIQSTGWSPGNNLWAPAIINESPPGVIIRGLTAASGGIVPFAIGIALLMLLSKLPEMIPQFIFMIKPSPWGQAIGQGMGELDPRKSFFYKEGSMFARSQFLGPSLEQIGQRLGSSNNTVIQRLGNKLEDYGLVTQGRKPTNP